jgi:uncharacterized membrane protein YdjX (TVP38/TMEM64 family)
VSKKAGCALASWLVGVSVVMSYAHSVGETPLQMFKQGVAWMGASPWGPVAFMVAFCCRPVTLLPASLFSVSAGFCFGAGWGFVWAHLAGTLAALLFYVLGYWLGLKRGLLGWWDRAIESIRRQGVISIIVLRFCFTPYDPVSYLGGALRLPLIPFVVANFFGNLPGTTSCVMIGASMQGQFSEGNVHVNWRLLGVSWVMLLLMLGIGRWLRRRSGLSQTSGSLSFSGEGSAHMEASKEPYDHHLV